MREAFSKHRLHGRRNVWPTVSGEVASPARPWQRTADRWRSDDLYGQARL